MCLLLILDFQKSKTFTLQNSQRLVKILAKPMDVMCKLLIVQKKNR